MGRKGTRSRTRSSRRKGRKGRGGSRIARTLAKAIVPFGLLMTQKRLHKNKKGKSRRRRRRSSRSRK